MSATGNSIIEAVNARPMGFSNLTGLDCSIRDDDRVMLLGPDNDMLSRYMKILAGVEPSASGTVLIDGQDTSSMDNAGRRRLRSRIGYVPQAVPLLSVISGRQNMMLAARYHALADEAVLVKRANALLNDLPEASQHDNLPAYMSERLRRLLALARPLMLEPQVLFIENPLHGLDHADRAIIEAYLLSLQRDRRMALVISSDDLGLALRFGGRLLFCDGDRSMMFASARDMERVDLVSLRSMQAQQNMPQGRNESTSDTGTSHD